MHPTVKCAGAGELLAVFMEDEVSQLYLFQRHAPDAPKDEISVLEAKDVDHLMRQSYCSLRMQNAM